MRRQNNCVNRVACFVGHDCSCDLSSVRRRDDCRRVLEQSSVPRLFITFTPGRAEKALHRGPGSQLCPGAFNGSDGAPVSPCSICSLFSRRLLPGITSVCAPVGVNSLSMCIEQTCCSGRVCTTGTCQSGKILLLNSVDPHDLAVPAAILVCCLQAAPALLWYDSTRFAWMCAVARSILSKSMQGVPCGPFGSSK